MRLLVRLCCVVFDTFAAASFLWRFAFGFGIRGGGGGGGRLGGFLARVEREGFTVEGVEPDSGADDLYLDRGWLELWSGLLLELLLVVLVVVLVLLLVLVLVLEGGLLRSHARLCYLSRVLLLLLLVELLRVDVLLRLLLLAIELLLWLLLLRGVLLLPGKLLLVVCMVTYPPRCIGLLLAVPTHPGPLSKYIVYKKARASRSWRRERVVVVFGFERRLYTMRRCEKSLEEKKMFAFFFWCKLHLQKMAVRSWRKGVWMWKNEGNLHHRKQRNSDFDRFLAHWGGKK